MIVKTLFLLQTKYDLKVHKSELFQIVIAKKNDAEKSEFLVEIKRGFSDFFSEFSTHFNIVKFSYRSHAFDYLQSLFKLEKKTANCQQIADMLSAQSQQNINHFINSDHWSFRELMDQVATSASQMFAQHNSPVALLIDELDVIGN